MRAPGFWYRAPQKPNWRRTALAPLGALYARATARRVARSSTGYKAACPVICVGNLTAGGAGKTPTTLALVELLMARGLTPAIVSRGYGGRLEGPVRVDPAVHSADDVGDEPTLMSAFAPVYVARDRAAGVQMAEGAADVIVMDDGFQNPSVQKDLSIVVVDAVRGFGNGGVIPAGPLREPVAAGLARADAVLIVGTTSAKRRHNVGAGIAPEVPRLTARLEPLQTGMTWSGLRVLAFAGIAHPERFFQTLEALGADVVGRVALGDHERFSPQMLTRLRTEAKAKSAQLVTTEKDAARLPTAFLREVLTLPVRLVFDDPDAIGGIVDQAVERR